MVSTGKWPTWAHHPPHRPSCGLPLACGAIVRTPQAACRATALQTEPRQRANPAPWLRASDHRRTSCPAAAAPLRRPANSHSPACGLRLAACRRLPCRVLHHARGCATGFASPAIAVPPAPTFGLGGRLCVLPAACAVGEKPPTASSATLGKVLSCSLYPLSYPKR
jgi:hypothetical protein